MIGTRLGPYEIIEEIGKGGMATVYRAYQPSVDRYVAIKVIHRSIINDPTSLERFQREARVIARLEHPHLVPVHDFDGLHDPPYIVMRYLEGGTLRDILDRSGKLPMSDTAFLLRQIASAVDYAHRQGVVHRDIKPSNIMIDQEGNAFLMDFGVARLVSIGGEAGLPTGMTLTQGGFAVGTPGYMSPEQCMGLEGIDSRADIYSLGVMLFEMLTDSLPFTGETPMAAILKHINEPVPNITDYNDELPAAVNDIIKKSMAKLAEDRYQTASALAEEFVRAVGKVSSNVRPDTLREGAEHAVSAIRERREEHKDELNATMAQFEAARAVRPKTGTRRNPSVQPDPDEDQPTLLTPTPIDMSRVTGAAAPVSSPASSGTASAPQAPAQGGNRIILLIAALAVVVIGALIILTQSNDNNGSTTVVINPTATDTGVGAAVVTDEATAQADATENVALNIVPTTAIPTAILPDTATNTPTDTSTATDTATATATFTDAATNTPTATDTDTATPTATLTATPSTPEAIVVRQLAARQGPDTDYPVVATVDANARLTITGLSEDGAWFQVQLEDGTLAWLTTSPALVNSFGDINSLPIAEPPTATPTLTDTPTVTPTDTETPSATPTSSDTPTDTPTATETASPTETQTATDTPTNTPTETPTDTPTPTSTDTPTPSPTPTPIPFGQMPYVVNFDNPRELGTWSYNPQVWGIAFEDGDNILLGRGIDSEPLGIIGRQQPEWIGVDPLLVSLSFNLQANDTTGFRLIFGANDSGYYAAHVLQDSITLYRGSTRFESAAVNGTTGETILGAFPFDVAAGVWHRLGIWSQMGEIHVYIDGALIYNVRDTAPTGGGAIFLQMNNSTVPVRIDDVVIQRPEAGSTHFSENALPANWSSSNPVFTTVGQDTDGNPYLRLEGDLLVTPATRPLGDLSLTCRLWVEQGGVRFTLRQGPTGATAVELRAGRLTVTQIDAGGSTIASFNQTNFYAINQWEQVAISFIGDRLEIVNIGGSGAVNRFSQTIPGSNGVGTIEMISNTGDAFRVDDCLIAEGIPTSNLLARPFLALRFRAEQLPITPQNAVVDSFDDARQTQNVWLGSVLPTQDDPLPAELVNLPGATVLRMVHLEQPTWLLLRDDLAGQRLFGRGSDRQSFSDATNIYASVDVRFAEGSSGTAWMAVRAARSLMSPDLDGYRLEVRREANGAMSVIVRYVSAMEQTVYYGGALSVTPQTGEFTRLEAIASADRVAFFANGVFLVAINNSDVRGGAVGLGVEANTTAEFDNLIVRGLAR